MQYTQEEIEKIKALIESRNAANVEIATQIIANWRTKRVSPPKVRKTWEKTTFYMEKVEATGRTSS